MQPFFAFDIERVICVQFSSSNYTVKENKRSFTGTLTTPGYHARAFTVYVVTNDTNATATGEHHAVVYCQTCASILVCCIYVRIATYVALL